MTDTCSVQEEATALGIRCYTLLDATPSTVTLTHGTNVLLGEDAAGLRAALPAGARSRPLPRSPCGTAGPRNAWPTSWSRTSP